jgi:hypothetical protein
MLLYYIYCKTFEASGTPDALTDNKVDCALLYAALFSEHWPHIMYFFLSKLIPLSLKLNTKTMWIEKEVERQNFPKYRFLRHALK